MKIPIWSELSSETKQELLGSVISSLTFHSERYLSRTQVGYPAQLNQKLEAHLPRYGEIVTSLAPVTTTYVLARKNDKFKGIRNGSILYSIPHLLQRTVVSASYAEGVAARPSAALTRVIQPLQVKYVAPATQARKALAQTTGKYRVTG